MPVQILMPALSPTMEEGKLAKWLVTEGQKIKAGDIIAEIETDKATMEVEAVDEGIVSQILVAAGTEKVKVNTPIAVLTAEGEKAAAPAPKPMAPTAPAPKPQAMPAATPTPLRTNPVPQAATAAAAPAMAVSSAPDWLMSTNQLGHFFSWDQRVSEKQKLPKHSRIVCLMMSVP